MVIFLTIMEMILYRIHNTHPNTITLNIKVDEVSLGHDLAIPLGFIINELVSNSLKHGFPSKWKGKGLIAISLRSKNNKKFELTVFDNGVGLPDYLNLDKIDTFGLHLVKMLTDGQLQSNLILDRRKSAEFKIVFNRV